MLMLVRAASHSNSDDDGDNGDYSRSAIGSSCRDIVESAKLRW